MRIEDALELQHLDPEAKQELKDANQSVKDLKAMAMVAGSEGGTKLLEMLKEDCRDILTQMLNAKKAGEVEKVMPLLSDFEAKFTLFNTIKSAEKDYQDADDALNERLEEILEG